MMFDPDDYTNLPDIRNARHRGEAVTLKMGPADAVHHQVFGSQGPASVETLLDALACAEPDSREERRDRARRLGRNKSKNARGRQWWNL
jgi:uncharacterized protein (DUF58 family)